MLNSRLPHPASSRIAAAPSGSEGVALLELIVALALLAGTLVAAVTLTNGTNRLQVGSIQLNDLQSRIDTDVAEIRGRAEIFTWCTGAGTFAASGPTCASTNPRSDNYFFPNSSTADAANPFAIGPEQTAFINACGTTALTTALVNDINARALPAGVTSRVVANDDATANRLRITYTAPNVSRIVVLTPTVAAWCP